jgi:hypothetical protein
LNLFCWTISPDRGPILFPADQPEAARPVAADPHNFAACVTAAARLAGDGLLVTLPPDLISLDAHWKERLETAVLSDAEAIFFYGDYVVRENGHDHLQSVREDIGDITEREDWGPVWAVRVEWLNSIGGLDEEHHRAAFYDLLLKSWRRRLHVGGPLAIVPAPQTDTDQNALKSKLFFPGRGKLGGFSYLFMDPEDERHTEAVFYNFLKRENAWLECERNLSPPPLAGGTGGVHLVKGPAVSVVTPVFNRADFIGKAIESVQRQSFTDWEYVIVDNGSTDSTREVVKTYAQRDPRIRLIENDRNVIALSLNLGVRAAKGKYISQLDSDDEYLPRTLEMMVAQLESHPTWGIAIGYYELMDEAGNVLPEFGVIRHLEYNRNNILRVDGAGAPRMWHRAVILEFGGFDEKELGHYGEDYDLVLKCGEKYEVGRVHEICYRYRRHPDNTDVKRDPELKISNKTKARLKAIERRKSLNGAR